MPAKKKTPDGPLSTQPQDKARSHPTTAVPTGDCGIADQPEAAAAEEIDDREAPQAPRFPIVGIGASAGGLEALQEFFGHTPAETGVGFVVVTHQHPGHVSLLPNLLAKSTSMPVLEAEDGTEVKPNHVYVGVPGGLLAITGGVLRRLDADSTCAPHLPIDYFFRSLAEDQHEHAICIVLSGTGADGTLGTRAIKAESGMAMVQEPPSAKYAGMPSSAMATGLADYILSAADMPGQLVAYTKGPYLKNRVAAAPTAAFPKEPLQRILALLRARTGHDFASYKMNTIRRRIERRMNVHQIKEAPEYVRYLQDNPHEIDMLFSELLISVTSFFRDPAAFEVLAEKALPDLLGSRSDGHTLRVWIPGCASGEEAYSIAIILHECMAKMKPRFDVQIFGTDLDAHAIEAARAGVYAAGITANVSPERLERYFVREDNTYRIRKEIREMLVFAPQNVIKDPPFTKLDLIVCRNVLIYLDADLQRRLLPVFHYAMRPGGLLFLGPSESIGGYADLFEPLNNQWKIFRRKETASPVYPIMEMPAGPKAAAAAAAREAFAPVKPSHTIAHIERLLLGRFAPTTLVVDQRGTIVYIHGRTGAYLEPSEGQPRNNLLEMARHGLLRPLTAALRQAAIERREIVRENVRVKTNGDYMQVNFSVARIEEPEPIRGLLMVTIFPSPGNPPPGNPPASEAAASPAAPVRKAEDQPTRVDELEHELQFTKESLQTTIEELETSNEELKSINEELQSTNEELQSTNEELETSKEEMQSLNEELSTVNTELEAKVDELSRATDDMQNLLNSTQVATIFLDSQFNVKHYTDTAKDLFNLIQSDIGRPLSHLTSNLEYDRLIDDCRQVLRSLVPKEVEVHARNGAWHLMRIMPYRTAENVIDGVVITSVNVTPMRRAKQDAEAVSECFSDIVQAAQNPMAVLDDQCRVIAGNAAFNRLCGVGEKAAAGKTVRELSERRLDFSPVSQALEDLAAKKIDTAEGEAKYREPRAAPAKLRFAARRLDGFIGAMRIVLALTD